MLLFLYYWCTRVPQTSACSPATPCFTCKTCHFCSGRCWSRSSDPLLVREARDCRSVSSVIANPLIQAEFVPLVGLGMSLSVGSYRQGWWGRSYILSPPPASGGLALMLLRTTNCRTATTVSAATGANRRPPLHRYHQLGCISGHQIILYSTLVEVAS